MKVRKLPGWSAGIADELVEVERRHLRQIDRALRHARGQLVVEGDRRAAGRQPEHQGGIGRERAGETIGQRAGGGALIAKDGQTRRTGRSHHSD